MNNNEIVEQIIKYENVLRKMRKMSTLNRNRYISQITLLRNQLTHNILNSENADKSILISDSINFINTLTNVCCSTINSSDFSQYLSLIGQEYYNLTIYDKHKQLHKQCRQSMCDINGYLYQSDVEDSEYRINLVNDTIKMLIEQEGKEKSN